MIKLLKFTTCLIAAFSIVIGTMQSAGADGKVPPLTMNTVLQACALNPSDRDYCETLYLLMVQKAYTDKPSYNNLTICPPPGVDYWQSVRIVQQAAQLYPQYIHFPAVGFATMALSSAFPCAK